MRIEQHKIRKALREIREILNLSQRDLAKELWASPGTVANWESGKRKIKGPQAKLIGMFFDYAKQVELAAILGVRHSDLKFSLISNKELFPKSSRNKIILNDIERKRLIKRFQTKLVNT